MSKSFQSKISRYVNHNFKSELVKVHIAELNMLYLFLTHIEDTTPSFLSNPRHQRLKCNFKCTVPYYLDSMGSVNGQEYKHSLISKILLNTELSTKNILQISKT